MILLSEKSKQTFARISDSLLGLLFLLMVGGFFLDRSGLEHDLARQIIIGAVVVALIATPIRLLVMALLLFKERQRRIAQMSLSLIVILALGSLLKWYFL